MFTKESDLEKARERRGDAYNRGARVPGPMALAHGLTRPGSETLRVRVAQFVGVSFYTPRSQV